MVRVADISTKRNVRPLDRYSQCRMLPQSVTPMATNIISAVASAIAARIVPVNCSSLASAGPTPWLVEVVADAIVDAILPGPDGATSSNLVGTFADDVTYNDIEAIADELAEALMPLLSREELPADKVEI